MALVSRDQEKNFLKYLNSEKWPVLKKNVCTALLGSEILDTEIKSNERNEDNTFCTRCETMSHTLLTLVEELYRKLAKEGNGSTEPPAVH